DMDEAARIRDLWAIIEERVSWPSDVGRHWEARFVDVASRPNDRVDLCADWLRELTPLQRREVWRELMEHLRDQELTESHRPFQRALSGRLEALGLDLPPEVLGALSSIGLAAYESCAHDPWVARGYCICSQVDIERYAEWVEVPSGTRQRLQSLSPPVISHHLRTLAASEEGLLQGDLDAEAVRDLRGFRDAYLCVRYRRDVSSVLGTDPLTLAEDRLHRGFDKGCILAELERLAEAASPDLEVPSLVPQLPTPEPIPVPEQSGAEGDTDEDGIRRRSTPLRPETYPEVPLETDLPPLPRPPPPRERPTTRRRMELPPLPEVPPARPPSRTSLERVVPPVVTEPPPPPPAEIPPAPP
ncbi:MAG: hypothetical protein VX938_07630, partial [Myxococcota bacterium]|nr:hypothetical protein [Myxococcota bacterium]